MLLAVPVTDLDNNDCTPVPVAPDDVNLVDNTADRGLKLLGVNPNVALVRAAVLAAKEVTEWKALEGVANVASVVEIVRTAVDTGRLLLEEREGIL